MHISNIFALLSLAVLGSAASHDFHPRHGHHRFPRRHYGNSSALPESPVSEVEKAPSSAPIVESAPAPSFSLSVPLSTGVSSAAVDAVPTAFSSLAIKPVNASIPVTTSTSTTVEKDTTTMTVVSGTSTTVLTSTIERTLTKTVVVTLGEPSPSAKVAAASSIETYPSTIVNDVTAVMTYGNGPSASTLTTTFQSKTTTTITKTVHAVKTLTAAGNKVDAAGASGAAGEEPTTTISSTSTITAYLTVTPVPSGTLNSPVGTGAPGSDAAGSGAGVGKQEEGGAAAGGASSSCAPPTTVTVTKQETVTVTATSSTTVAGEEPASKLAFPSLSKGLYDLGNGTDARATIASTGFATRTKLAQHKSQPTLY